ncbi:hypothetical protein EDC26_11854 [Paralcaligenes ureilyticus]|uniref:Uncharacterized protein n=1 Tax=Paralcaligenes ureilyticus TaxID=627131 RepID=A0A4R3LS04_9BURK|nr:hypothetical protein EDC26_11854 [Paralcaligenes ureilyticus]
MQLLSGLRVVDMSRVVGDPMASLRLADRGSNNHCTNSLDVRQQILQTITTWKLVHPPSTVY